MIFSMIATNYYPAYFLGAGYGKWCAQNDYAARDYSYNRVLIIGDSLAQVSYMPSELSPDTYNYGVGNENPVDGYYRLVWYLANHPKPEYIICSYNPEEFSTQGGIWQTTIGLHTLPYSLSKMIIDDARNYSSDSGLLIDNATVQLWAYYFGIHPDSIRRVFRGMMYNLFSGSCYENYVEIYNWIAEHNGHFGHKTDGDPPDSVHKTISPKGYEQFVVTDIADAYMRKIIELCIDSDIKLIVETVPYNKSTYDVLEPLFFSSYRGYWEQLQSEYPELVVNSDITYYDSYLFGDTVHFNPEGTCKFSKFIRNKYAYIFEETNT